MIFDIIQLFTCFYILAGLFMMMGEGKVESIAAAILKSSKDNNYGPIMQMWSGFYIGIGAVFTWPWLIGKKK